MGLSREEILAAARLPRETVHVSELGGDVCVWGLSASDWAAFQLENVRLRKQHGEESWTRDYDERLLARCLRSDAGVPMFQPEEAHLIGGLEHRLVERLAKIASRLNFGGAESDEDLAGKSEGTPGDGGSSDSVSPSASPTSGGS